MTSIVIAVFELIVSLIQDHFTQLDNFISCEVFKDEVIGHTRTEAWISP